MGCWNGTCGISQLPIRAGQNVLGFLIGLAGYNDSRGASGHCYSTDWAFPISLPFYGKYDSYGRIEDIRENFNTEIILNTYGKEADDIYALIDLVERDNYVCSVENSSYIKEFPVGLFMVLEDIVKSFAGLRTSYEKYCGYFPKKHFYQDAKYYFEWVAEETKRRRKIHKKLNSADEHFIFDSRSECKKSGDFDNQFALVFSRDGIFDPWRPYRKYIQKLALNNGNTTELVDNAFDYEVVYRAMAFLRKSWFPQAGKGSQNEDYEFYWRLTTAMRKHIKENR